MNTSTKLIVCLFLVFMSLTLFIGVAVAQLDLGDEAPGFALEDVYGRKHKLSSMGDKSLIILYFFDTESSSSQEGLLGLNNLIKKHPESDLVVWGVTQSSKNKISSFIDQHDVGFPVMMDASGISAIYEADFVLPTIYILGPGLKIIDSFQGSGASVEKVMFALAERQLQRDEPMIALTVAEEIKESFPNNADAEALYGYAALKGNQPEVAVEQFEDMASRGGDVKILGKEGKAKILFDEGKPELAMNLIEEIEEEAPDRGYANVLKGDYYYSQDKKEEALEQYKIASVKPEGLTLQKTYAENKYGRLLADIGEYDQARIQYDNIVEMDPYNLVAMSNKGITYQKEGDLDKAMESFQMAMDVNSQDSYARILARKTQELMNLQKNIAEKERVDRLVKELAERYRKQSTPLPLFNKEDTWTSRPMIMSFIDFLEKGGLTERDGISTVLIAQLTELINQSGRVQVVERVIMDRLLEELNLGSSDLADPETALKLGRIFAAKVVSTGTMLHLPDSTLLSMRLIDSETTAIPKVLTMKMTQGAEGFEEAAQGLNRQILQTMVEKYPLKAFVVQAKGNSAIINIGSEQGVVQGTMFEVIAEAEPVKYKGKVMKGLPTRIGKVKVIRVEPGMSTVEILEKDRPLQTDDKIIELTNNV